jgi:hypothetical protein
MVPLLSGCGDEPATDATPTSSAQSIAPAKVTLPKGWMNFAPEGSGFSVAMPSEPMKKAKKGTKDTSGVGSVELTYSALSKGVAYTITHTTLGPEVKKELEKSSNQELLDGIARAMVEGATVQNDENISIQGQAAKDITFTTKEDTVMTMQSKLVASNGVLLSISASAKTEAELSNPEVKAYFDSIRLTDAPAGKE